ncbi:hypothetical protein VTO42DRAFT_6549 [Malbranchea cinnamomea]
MPRCPPIRGPNFPKGSGSLAHRSKLLSPPSSLTLLSSAAASEDHRKTKTSQFSTRFDIATQWLYPRQQGRSVRTRCHLCLVLDAQPAKHGEKRLG